MIEKLLVDVELHNSLQKKKRGWSILSRRDEIVVDLRNNFLYRIYNLLTFTLAFIHINLPVYMCMWKVYMFNQLVILMTYSNLKDIMKIEINSMFFTSL